MFLVVPLLTLVLALAVVAVWWFGLITLDVGVAAAHRKIPGDINA